MEEGDIPPPGQEEQHRQAEQFLIHMFNLNISIFIYKLIIHGGHRIHQNEVHIPSIRRR
jgi:hypothetical protein